MIEFLVYAAVVLTLLAAGLYIRSMFRGGAKPNRISWLMWAIAPFIAVAASVSSGVGLAVVPVFMAGFSPFLIFVASFFTKKAYWQLSRFDYVCGVLSALAFVFWYLTQNPSVAIMFSITSDGLATVPTFAKAWKFPETESIWPYAIGLFSQSVALVAVTSWIFSAYAFPIYLLFANAVVLVAIYHKKLLPSASN